MAGSIKQSWAEVQLRLKNALGTAGGRKGNAQEMLKYSDVNRRIISVDQARWGAFTQSLYNCFVANSTLPYPEASQLYSHMLNGYQVLEKYQLTLDDGQDARNEFIEVKQAEAKAKQQRGNSLMIETGGGGGDDSGGNT